MKLFHAVPLLRQVSSSSSLELRFFVTYAKVVERVMSLGWLCLKVLVRNKQICEENSMGFSENSLPLNPIGDIPHFQSHPNVTKKRIMAWQKDLGHVESCRLGSSSSSSSTTFAPQSVASIISAHSYPYTNNISSHDIICLFKQHPHCKFNVLMKYDKISNGDFPQVLTSIFALDAQKKIITLEFSLYFHHPAKIKYGNKNVLSK